MRRRTAIIIVSRKMAVAGDDGDGGLLSAVVLVVVSSFWFGVTLTSGNVIFALFFAALLRRCDTINSVLHTSLCSCAWLVWRLMLLRFEK